MFPRQGILLLLRHPGGNRPTAGGQHGVGNLHHEVNSDFVVPDWRGSLAGNCNFPENAIFQKCKFPAIFSAKTLKEFVIGLHLFAAGGEAGSSGGQSPGSGDMWRHGCPVSPEWISSCSVHSSPSAHTSFLMRTVSQRLLSR